MLTRVSAVSPRRVAIAMAAASASWESSDRSVPQTMAMGRQATTSSQVGEAADQIDQAAPGAVIEGDEADPHAGVQAVGSAGAERVDPDDLALELERLIVGVVGVVGVVAVVAVIVAAVVSLGVGVGVGVVPLAAQP